MEKTTATASDTLSIVFTKTIRGMARADRTSAKASADAAVELLKLVSMGTAQKDVRGPFMGTYRAAAIAKRTLSETQTKAIDAAGRKAWSRVLIAAGLKTTEPRGGKTPTKADNTTKAAKADKADKAAAAPAAASGRDVMTYYQTVAATLSAYNTKNVRHVPPALRAAAIAYAAAVATYVKDATKVALPVSE